MQSLRDTFKGFLPAHSFVMGKKPAHAGESVVAEASVAMNPLAAAPGAPSKSVAILFVGQVDSNAQILLDKMIDAMKVDRSAIALAPSLSSAQNIHAKVIVALGEKASAEVMGEQPFEQLRGKVQNRGKARALATFHPDHLLQNPALKKDAWEDLKKVLKELATAQ